MNIALWIIIIFFSAAMLLWIYKDGKFHHLMDTKIQRLQVTGGIYYFIYDVTAIFICNKYL